MRSSQGAPCRALRPFWKEFILSLSGPLSTVLIGTLIVGLFVSRITEAAQGRREDSMLRADLIRELAEVGTALYLATQHYQRTLDAITPPAAPDDRERATLDREYLRARAQADALEARLVAYFVDERRLRTWHSISDLLSVRYFQLIGRANDAYLAANSGPNHSGLTVKQLKDIKIAQDAYKNYSRRLPKEILEAPRRIIG